MKVIGKRKSFKTNNLSGGPVWFTHF